MLVATYIMLGVGLLFFSAFVYLTRQAIKIGNGGYRDRATNIGACAAMVGFVSVVFFVASAAMMAPDGDFINSSEANSQMFQCERTPTCNAAALLQSINDVNAKHRESLRGKE